MKQKYNWRCELCQEHIRAGEFHVCFPVHGTKVSTKFELIERLGLKVYDGPYENGDRFVHAGDLEALLQKGFIPSAETLSLKWDRRASKSDIKELLEKESGGVPVSALPMYGLLEKILKFGLRDD